MASCVQPASEGGQFQGQVAVKVSLTGAWLACPVDCSARNTLPRGPVVARESRLVSERAFWFDHPLNVIRRRHVPRRTLRLLPAQLPWRAGAVCYVLFG